MSNEKLTPLQEFIEYMNKNDMWPAGQFKLSSLDRKLSELLKKEEAGATHEAQKAAGLVKALEAIVNMKRLPMEYNDTYAFNRNWHLANEALANYKK